MDNNYTDTKSFSHIFEYGLFALIVLSVLSIIHEFVCSNNIDNTDSKLKETYVVYSERDKWRCNECSGLNRMQCGNCANCGYCYDFKGNGECVPGDENGPFFRKDCVDYEYISPVYYTDVYPGWSYFYDGYYYETPTGRYIRHCDNCHDKRSNPKGKRNHLEDDHRHNYGKNNGNNYDGSFDEKNSRCRQYKNSDMIKNGGITKNDGITKNSGFIKNSGITKDNGSFKNGSSKGRRGRK